MTALLNPAAKVLVKAFATIRKVKDQSPDGYDRLRAIVETLETAQAQIRDWFDAGHGGECKCRACAKPFGRDATEGDIFDMELKGTLYNVEHAISAIETYIC
jgi:hypothetical protein